MIQIKTLRYDDEHDIHLGIRFDSKTCSSYIEIYGQTGIFTDFAKELVDFPFGQVKTIGFQYGEDDDKWAYYLLITVDVFDPSGKIVVKTIVDNKGDATNHYRCEFPIITDVATVNELGRQLLKWTPVENETWSFPTDT
jgi:hypothetical protein